MTDNLGTKLSWSYAGASHATAISESTLRRAARLGQLKVHKLGRRVVIPDECLRDFVSGKDRTEPQPTAV